MKQIMRKQHENFATLPGVQKPDGEPIGSILLHEGTIATIVRRSVLSVEGVTRISGSSFIDNIAELVGSKKMQDRSVTIRFNGDKLSIEVSINILFGTSIREIAAAVQQRIVDNIQKITGLTVTGVNVSVCELEDMPEPPVPQSAETDQEKQ